MSQQKDLTRKELSPKVVVAPKKKTLKMLLIVLIILIIAAPIGLLAIGTAYGEWGLEELQDLLGYTPAGIEQWQNFWTSLFPDYSVANLDPNIGYWISAVVGVGLIFGVLLVIWKIKVKQEAQSRAGA
jgi:cobalt/nickel transport system permease protein